MKFKKVSLPFDENFISSLEDPNKTFVIVSIFGKSSLIAKSCKAQFVNNIYDRSIFNSSMVKNSSKDTSNQTKIECFYDECGKVIYLHLIDIFDTHTLVQNIDELSSEIEEKGFLRVWSSLKFNYACSLLFLFSISHILVLTHPVPIFDASYLSYFKALDCSRSKFLNVLKSVLLKIPNVPSTWIENTRLCSPRLLFYYETCPSEFKNHNKNVEPCHSGLKKAEHSLEDQIYGILRKRRIISNISTNSMFAIPANQEYVFMDDSSENILDWNEFFTNSLITMCNSTSVVIQDKFQDITIKEILEPNFFIKPHNFKKFIFDHIDVAFKKGFDDNIGRHASLVQNYFEIPAIGTWCKVANEMYKLFVLRQDLDDDAKIAFESIRSLLDIDTNFSERRCQKVQPIAMAAYQDNLPSHYTRNYHENKVAQALSVFALHARGPLFDDYIQILVQDCDKLWQSGRQMCEILSLTGNPCTQPLHKGGSVDGPIKEPERDDNSNQQNGLSTMEHSSSVVYLSACNCGHKQGTREDPFTIKAANYDFYQMIAKECVCSCLDQINFPVFQPSTQDYRAAQLFAKPPVIAGRKNSAGLLHTPTQLGNTQSLSLGGVFASCHSEDPINDILGEEPKHRENTDRQGLTTTDLINKTKNEDSVNSNQIVIRVIDTDNDVKDKLLVRQPSTTEYLPGMLHTESPYSLLPQFPSWSLICLGSSCLYSHNIGLQETQHPGFLNSTGYLLPWDVTVRLEHQPRDRFWNNDKNKINSSPVQRGRKIKGSREFSVKIFIGVEYECPRGHRFMCSAPDKILTTASNGIVKENGNKVSNSDMPLYFPCPCSSASLMAQLMRIHVVTPKAPVHVTLNPMVQPDENGPVFVTGYDKPIELTQSTYWVLRLPYIYAGERGPYLSPKDSTQKNVGKLLKGVYSVAEATSDNNKLNV
ncbi:nonsense-mediated mRNA decay factor SMG8 isoform X2 [Daktulosphaira vitifoliae]|uniref:nonsense-mediated mRNA decay factor SMG8 isoform X2 n=1 Tax=Daktulosphaira vitifoliae TaxID=58002 RepID=UPI0021A9AA87|nr:nonsense-mediated mRNA decay factor SMG8 isoform X2 [Daktulosphaira vitifoliae]